MGSGRGRSVDAIDSLQYHGIEPHLLGAIRRLRTSCLSIFCIRSRTGVATSQSSTPDVGVHERNRVGTRDLLCRGNDPVFSIRLYPPHRLFLPDPALFQRSCGACGETNLTFTTKNPPFCSRVSVVEKV